jgi:D-glycero-alpha-D-manno-heptose 1-phosphate guanylyltransferase
MEAIILAGGKGTRLQSVVSVVPKPMADINGKPFLEYVLAWLSEEGVSKVILAVGYKRTIIQKHFGDNWRSIGITYSVETKPLGTGGAIRQALTYCTGEYVYVVNGDTLFKVNLSDFSTLYPLSLACQYVENAARYGMVQIDNGAITAIHEKQMSSSGYINGGVNLIRKDLLQSYPGIFSFETDALPQLISSGQVGAITSTAYFIDIGIPEDYERAKRQL